MAATPISKKRKFVADGVFYAELNELLMRELVRLASRAAPLFFGLLACHALPFRALTRCLRCARRLRTATPAWRSA